MRTQMKGHLSESTSCKKRVARDCGLPLLQDDKLILMSTMKKDVEKEENNIQISDTRLKLQKRICERIS